MALFENITFLIIISLILFLTTIYLLFLYRIKKKEGKTLIEECNALRTSTEDRKKDLIQITNNLDSRSEEFRHFLDLEKNEKDIRNRLEDSKKKLEGINNEIENLSTKKIEMSDEITSIKEDISIYQPVYGLINVGFFEEPDYLFETSERFKEEIKAIREAQKILIKDGKAINIPDTIALTSNTSYVKKILSGQSMLMLKAFNVECDNLMALVKPSNYAKILERIDKLAADIEKSAFSLKCGFTKEYIELKFKECEIQYQFRLKDQREKEEQAAIKEQMREEQKAIMEFERALAKALREEKMFKEALEVARQELAISSDKDKEKLEAKIALLEQQLLLSEENEKRAKSMAEQTKRGHVYIISNIGSFRDDVYKIGLTRRLEPLDRVKELGDASVPFSFDVHAMIYSEDAPALESQLHKEFTEFRVNQVNHRKEFFQVTLPDIKNKVSELVGNDVDFKMTALAEDYYESLKLKGDLTTN